MHAYLNDMILSASGWRGVFADGEESRSRDISRARAVFASGAALVFADYIKSPLIKDCRPNARICDGFTSGKRSPKAELYANTTSIWGAFYAVKARKDAGTLICETNQRCLKEKGGSPCVVVGMDARPTGKAIAETAIKALVGAGCAVRFLGIAAAPEIMAYTRHLGEAGKADGFLYISASHNPIGHNGIKFGRTDGGVLSGAETEKLKSAIVNLFENSNNDELDALVSQKTDDSALKKVYNESENEKKAAVSVYKDFARLVWTDGNTEIERIVQENTKNKRFQVGIAADLNGSARAASCDKDFFRELGLKTRFINDIAGNIAHRIVPEGESLEPCKRLLEEMHGKDAGYVLGYVCDCDGDRGNLVVWDDAIGAARALEAQEVFALCVLAELAHSAWQAGGVLPPKNAVVVNDATSMRVDRIARAFGAKVFRAEVGEANVVALARELRAEGWTVRILGEGAAGGNITHPSAVRDPLATVMAIVKLLSVRNGAKGGLFEIWRKAQCSPSSYNDNFSLGDILKSLPAFCTTSSYEDEAILKIKVEDHALLKKNYQAVFERAWSKRKGELLQKYGYARYEAAAYIGAKEISPCADFSVAGKGGLKISFYKEGADSATAFIWMRGSGTESVFRILADVEGADNSVERELLDWQRGMVIYAHEAA